MEQTETTITEALAELTTIDKRIEKKRGFIAQHLLRQDAMRDPLEKDGGSIKRIAEERQAITDLLARKLAIRRAIQQANTENSIKIGDTERTIADWLVWRRDCAPIADQIMTHMRSLIEQMRKQAERQGWQVVEGAASKPTDVIVNVNEGALAREQEAMVEAIGRLDGLLSLKNATILIRL